MSSRQSKSESDAINVGGSCEGPARTTGKRTGLIKDAINTSPRPIAEAIYHFAEKGIVYSELKYNFADKWTEDSFKVQPFLDDPLVLPLPVLTVRWSCVRLHAYATGFFSFERVPV